MKSRGTYKDDPEKRVGLHKDVGGRIKKQASMMPVMIIRVIRYV
jgi:hypothetical protein